jgi:uncharacterized membrane protein (UPF0127 family)
MLVRNETRNSVLADIVEVADTSAKRCRGLLGRDNLKSGEALWIVPCEGIHTWGMKFPIDVLYLDRKKRVRKIRKVMKPWRLSFCFLARSVVELPAGVIDQTGTQPGDQLNLSSC